MYTHDSYEAGYGVGFDEGRLEGYSQGYLDSTHDFDHRLSKYWAELHTLNARVDYLEKILMSKEY